MSSHSLQLGKALKNFSKLKEVHKENVSDEYTRGLYNGLELAHSLLCYTEPNFKEKKDKRAKKLTDDRIKEIVND